MAELKADNGAPVLRPRPLSPHLSVWRWHITMAASIFHRVTGVGLYLGALILTLWVLCLAEGPGPYTTFTTLMGSIVGKLLLFGLTVCVFFHMANGIRHLVWDSGRGFLPKTADFTAVVAMAFGVVAAVAVWGLAFLTGGL